MVTWNKQEPANNHPANFARLQEIAASPELVEELREAMVDPAGKTARQVLNRVLRDKGMKSRKSRIRLESIS